MATEYTEYTEWKSPSPRDNAIAGTSTATGTKSTIAIHSGYPAPRGENRCGNL
jgi:hypothetical protein